jgi:hypothetical protein
MNEWMYGWMKNRASRQAESNLVYTEYGGVISATSHYFQFPIHIVSHN